MPLDDIIGSDKDTARRHAALNLNIPFAPNSFQHEPLNDRFSSRNTPLLYHVLEPLSNSDPLVASEAVEIANWVITTIQLPTAVKDEIEDAMEETKKHLI